MRIGGMIAEEDVREAGEWTACDRCELVCKLGANHTCCGSADTRRWRRGWRGTVFTRIKPKFKKLKSRNKRGFWMGLNPPLDNENIEGWLWLGWSLMDEDGRWSRDIRSRVQDLCYMWNSTLGTSFSPLSPSTCSIGESHIRKRINLGCN